MLTLFYYHLPNVDLVLLEPSYDVHLVLLTLSEC